MLISAESVEEGRDDYSLESTRLSVATRMTNCATAQVVESYVYNNYNITTAYIPQSYIYLSARENNFHVYAWSILKCIRFVSLLMLS